jgi:hypothetical protein
MGGRKSIYLACAVILLSGFSGMMISEDEDHLVQGQVSTLVTQIIELDFKPEMERKMVGGSYCLMPSFDDCIHRSVGPGYSIPFLSLEIPARGNLENLRIEYLNPVEYKSNPVPYPGPEQAVENHHDKIFPSSCNIGTHSYYHSGSDLLGEDELLHILLSPISYTQDGVMTFYLKTKITYRYYTEIESELGDKSSVNKPTGNIDYLIITTDDLEDSLRPLADWKSRKGVFAHIETVEDIVKKYEGRDDPERIRNYIMEMNQEHSIIYLLLAGDYNDVPVRETINSKVLIPNAEPDYFASDIYYACVDPDTTWDRDGDGVFGEVGDIDDPVLDMIYGRLAIHSPTIMSEKITELIEREKNPIRPSVSEDMVILANELGSDPESVDFTEAVLKRQLIDQKMDVRKVYFDGTGDEDFTTNTLIERLENSYQFNIYLGHGNPDGYQDEIYNEDVLEFEQENLGGYLFAMSCLGGWFDDPSGFREYRFDDCIGETFTETPGVGVVGYSGSNRLAVSPVSYTHLTLPTTPYV